MSDSFLGFFWPVLHYCYFSSPYLFEFEMRLYTEEKLSKTELVCSLCLGNAVVYIYK